MTNSSKPMHPPGLPRYARFALFGLVLWAVQGMAVAEWVTLSTIDGRALLDGQPVAGAGVERQFNWGWEHETGTDHATTDSDRAFSLPAIERSSLPGSLSPLEVVIDQTPVIAHGGKTYKARALFKRDGDINNSELGGKPLERTCRLDKTPARSGNVFGICELD